jgi:hypothetical protein
MVNESYIKRESKLIQREFNEKKTSWFDTRIRFNEVIDSTSNLEFIKYESNFFEL